MKNLSRYARFIVDKRWKRYAIAWLAIIVASAGLVVNAPGLTDLVYRLQYTAVCNGIPVAKGFNKSDRILVIAPHPDDEILACTGSILAAKRAGAEMHILWLTSGDGFEWDKTVLTGDPLPVKKDMLALGRKRMEEALAAVRTLSLSVDACTFLGYPDGGLMHIVDGKGDSAYKSRYTGADSVPYEGTLSPGAAYTRTNLQRDIISVIDRFEPTIVYAPSVYDHHRDHKAAGLLISQLFAERGEYDRLRFYIVHGGLEWPVPKELHKSLPLVPPRSVDDLNWKKIPLTDSDISTKLSATKEYRSQLKVMPHFLYAFVRTNELETADTRS